MFFGRGPRQGLKPVGIVRGAFGHGPGFHGRGHGIGHAALHARTLFHGRLQFFKVFAGHRGPHGFQVKHVLAKAIGAARGTGIYSNSFALVDKFEGFETEDGHVKVES